MRIDNILPDDPDKMQVVQPIPVKTEKLLDRITPYKGHTLFEIDCTTGEITEAKYEEINARFDGGGVKKKVLVKDNCLYISCLNKKSALKKYTNWMTDRLMQTLKNKIDEKTEKTSS